MSVEVEVSASQDYYNWTAEEKSRDITVKMESINQAIDGSVEVERNQDSKACSLLGNELLAQRGNAIGSLYGTIPLNGSSVSTFPLPQAVPSVKRTATTFSSIDNEGCQVEQQRALDEAKATNNPHLALATEDEHESFRMFPFADEADEQQASFFGLESIVRYDNVAGSDMEEAKEWRNNDEQKEPSKKERFAGVSSGINTPPSSLHEIPSAPLPLKNIDDETLTSSVSSAQLGSIMNTPSGPCSLAASNADSIEPVLYSAISSLEKCSAISFGEVRTQYHAMSGRAFDRPTIPQTLIPPAPSKPASRPRTLEPNSKKSGLVDLEQESKNVDGTIKLAGGNNALKRGGVETRTVRATATTKTRTQDHDGVVVKGTSERGKLKKVTIKDVKSRKPVEMFRPSCDAYTPRMEKKKIKYKPAEMRTPVQKISSTMGTLVRPNFRDALRRVAMILQQHITKIERRFEDAGGHFSSDGLFKAAMREAFSEEKYSTPRYKCTMVRIPMARPGMVYGLRNVRAIYSIPSEEEIYEFGHKLFKSVQLSSECSIVCLIYVERLMESAKVPLLASTWRPIFMCGLLLASKVWQDLSSWNIEFASVYPQFSLEAINKLELEFLRMVKWDLYISSSLYAKYYFALRSLLEKPDFRMRYNRMVGGVGSVDASEALKVQQRSERVKEAALMQLSHSM
jgi:hypothetical protein